MAEHSSDRIRIQCPQCGKSGWVPASKAGAKSKCPGCNTSFVVSPVRPASAKKKKTANSPSSTTDQASPLAESASVGNNTKKKKRKRYGETPGEILESGSFNGFVAGGGVALLAALLGAGLWYVVAIYTAREFGPIAVGIGLLAGAGMAIGYRDHSDVAGMVAAIITALGILSGKYLVFTALIASGQFEPKAVESAITAHGNVRSNLDGLERLNREQKGTNRTPFFSFCFRISGIIYLVLGMSTAYGIAAQDFPRFFRFFKFF